MLKIVNVIRLLCCLGLLYLLGTMALEITQRSAVQQQRKYDQANINHMKYEMFNVNLWKKKMTGIVVKEIENFKITDDNKVVLKKEMERQLDVLIDKVNEQIREANKDSTKGWFKQKLMNMLVDMKTVKAGIPKYADAIVGQLTSDETQDELKSALKEKISAYLKKTYSPDDVNKENEPIVARAGAKNIEEARAILDAEVPVETANLFDLAWKYIAVMVALIVLAGVHRGRIPVAYFYVCWLALIMTLYVGLLCPMIDMDARVPRFGFFLLGHKIEFLNQTVYYQSKSILDVFLIMIRHEKIEMRFVGVLLVMFSVVFPVLKLTFANIYYYNIFGLRENFLVKAMVMKSGKWSMADVMAVAVLMSFIGFNGMISTQLSIMKKTFPDMEFISTNATTLQIGFYIFLTFVICSIFFSMFISKGESTPKPA